MRDPRWEPLYGPYAKPSFPEGTAAIALHARADLEKVLDPLTKGTADRSFVVTLSASAVVALAGCSSSVAADGGPAPTSCPASAPAPGAPCSGSFECQFCTGDPRTQSAAQCVGDHFESEASLCNPPPPCPDTRPTIGSACTRGFGFWPVSCDFTDTCVDRATDGSVKDNYTCGDGQWKLASAAYVAKCPGAAPIDGASCLCGVHLYGDCNYDDCSGTPTTTAHCDQATGKWAVIRSTCNPPPLDAGPFDGGTPETGGEVGP